MKTALIIGGSSGIGRACVNLFSEKNWDVFATFHSKGQIGTTDRIRWSFLDIRDIPDNFFDDFPPIDAVVICAAKNITQSLSDLKKKDTQEIVDTNLIGQIEFIRLLRNRLAPNSSIVLFGSVVSVIGFRRRIAYGITKAAMKSLTKTLASEFSPNTRVNCIMPAYIKTDSYLAHNAVEESIRVKKILLRRLGKPEEVAQLAFFLSSEDSSYINGESIGINGGFNYDYEFETE
ncbi:MAG: SDR family oxidoreductase [Candidatus Uhrbacteria bacterium]|nr:SDR family oxidoreductase [Candidatus Uhrbacteria bacterium]